MTKKALIVEDSKIAALAIRKALLDTSYSEIEIIHDGDIALSTYDKFLPDVVTMDINMPGLNGIEASLQILEKHPQANIIVITDQQFNDEDKKKLTGIKEIILKPISVSKIHAAIDRL